MDSGQLITNWGYKRLDEVCKVVNGGTPKTKIKEYWGGQHFWVTPAEMGKRKTPFISETKRTLTNIGMQNTSAQLVPPLSVILSTRAPIGHLVLNTVEMAFNQGCRGLVPEDNLEYKFLYYFLLGNVDLLNDLGTGATFKELSATKLKCVNIPFPPLPEQKRIVAILDKAFTGITLAVANAEKNLANARELFESYLNERLLKIALQPVTQTLSDICELIVDCEHKTAPKQETGYPSIRTPNVGKGYLILDKVNRVSEETYDLWTRRAKPLPGDLILAREAPAGNIGVIPEGEEVCLGQRTVLIRPKNDVVNPYYFAYLILHPFIQQRLLSHSTGATVQHVNMKDIRQLKIGFLPSLEEQMLDIQEIDKAKAAVNKLETIYQQKLTALKELKQSILQKAFSGQLTNTIDKDK